MEKSNQINYPILPVIEDRKSVRAYKETPVEQEKIDSIFEAARWSFSSSNEQPWRFIYAHKTQALWNDIFDILMDGNKTWNTQTPVLIVGLAAKNTSKDKINPHNLHDLGAATMLMSLQAASMGLQIHPMAGFFKEKAIQLLNIPETIEVVTVLSLGYPSNDFSLLNDYQQKNETTRSDRFLQQSFVLNKKFSG